MPFDCTPVIENPKPLGTRSDPPLAIVVDASLLAWDPNRSPESISSTIAVLVRARALIADQRHWCRGSLARSWCNIPVRPYSVFARRFCAIGAVRRAACELLLPTQNACVALESQAIRRIEGWNDDPRRTHAEVVSLFDNAILALRPVTV